MAPDERDFEVIRTIFRHWNEGDLDAQATYWSDDIVYADPPQTPDADVYRGKRAVARRMTEIVDTVGPLETRVGELRRVGGEILVELHLLVGGVGSGIAFSDSPNAQLVRLRDGLVTRVRAFTSVADALAAAHADDS